MNKTLSAMLLLAIATLTWTPAQAASDTSLPLAIDNSITEHNVSMAIKDLKKDADNLRLRLKQLEASLPREQKTAANNNND